MKRQHSIAVVAAPSPTGVHATDWQTRSAISPWIERLVGAIAGTLEVVTAVVLVVDVMAVAVTVIFRYFLDLPLFWSEELARLLLITLTFLGSAVASARGRQMRVELIDQWLRGRWSAVFDGFREAMGAVLMTFIAVGAESLAVARADTVSPALHLSDAIFIAPLAVGGALMGILAVLRTIAGSLWTWLGFALGVLLVLGVGSIVQPWLSGALAANRAGLLIVMAATAAGLLVLGVPIAYSLAWGGLVFFLTQTSLPLGIFVQRLAGGVDSFVLLAVPFFVLAGGLMDATGISRRLVEFLAAVLGGVRGGLGVVMIAAMYVFSGISGSKTADIAAVGSILIPSMRSGGDTSGRPVALLAASAAMGETVPPSIAILILGAVTSISIGAMLLGGVVPALVVAVLLAAFVAWQNAFRGTRGPTSPRQLASLFLLALPAIAMPLGLVVPILTGIATATEVSAFAVLYAALVGTASRELTTRRASRELAASVSLTGSILLIVSAATAFGYVLIVNQVPQQIAAWVASVGGGQVGFMLLTMVTLIVMGSVLEGLPALIIFGPLLVPAAAALHIDLVQYGIVMIMAMGLGAFLPPIGIGLYIACAVGKTPVGAATRPVLPYLMVVLVGLLLTAFIPPLSTTLPRLLR